MRSSATGSKRICAMFEVILGGGVAAALVVYLLYTLLHPEKF
jgi:K+-transporting ATPase KdpF subunit